VVYPRDELAFARAVTFFDAVFAIALTLLITTVNDFAPASWRGLPALWEANGSALTTFTISFVVIVRFWRSSHGELATFRHLNSRVIGLHTAVLFGVVLIPFTTEAMGEPGLRQRVSSMRVLPSVLGLTHSRSRNSATPSS